MRWFRFYSEAVHDPKVQALPAPLFKAWVNLLCIAALADKDGYLPRVEDLAYALHTPVKRAETMLSDLLKRELLDRDRRGIRPHNWNARQFKSDSSTERSRKHRSNAPAPLQQRPQRQRQRQRTENREQKAAAAGAHAPACQESPIFALYEDHVGTIDPHMADLLIEAEGEYSEECLRHSFAEASERNVHNWKYVEAILQRHKREGCYVEGPKKDRRGDGPKGSSPGTAQAGPDLEAWRRYAAGEQ